MIVDVWKFFLDFLIDYILVFWNIPVSEHGTLGTYVVVFLFMVVIIKLITLRFDTFSVGVRSYINSKNSSYVPKHEYVPKHKK